MRTGQKTNLVDKQKNAVLHHFAEYDDEKITRLLISYGANVNAANKQGRTALMIAAENGSIAVAKALLESGANVSFLDKKKATALDFADSAEMKTLLESYGAIAENGNGLNVDRDVLVKRRTRTRLPLPKHFVLECVDVRL